MNTANTIAAAVGTDTRDRVVRVISEHAFDMDVDLIGEGLHLAGDLGFGSLDTIEMRQDIEAEFGIEITDEEEQKLQTVGDVITLVTAKRAG